MKIERFEDIAAWQAGRELAKSIYSASKKGEFSRDFALRDQIRRAVGSIMHNIAEGFDGGSNAEFIKFLRYSQRSCSEVKSELYIALDQEYVSEKEFEALYEQTDKVKGKVGGFIKYLRDYEKANKFKAKNEAKAKTKN